MKPIRTVPLQGDESVNYYYYQSMLRAAERIRAFQSALQSAIREGDVVVEIGAGLGTYSLFAARCGARRVYAVERESIIALAEEIAADNGLLERIEFVRGDAAEITLPERADVLVIEDFSSLFLRRGLEEVVLDALQRHLAPDGIVIPAAVSLHVAPVEDRALWEGLAGVGSERYRPYGLDLSALARIMLHSPHVRTIDTAALLARPAEVKTIELRHPQSYLFDQLVSVRVEKTGTLHGLAGWFDLRLVPGEVLTNAPGNPGSLWRQVFFPFPHPIAVLEGETAVLRLACARSAGTLDLWWTWEAAAGSGSASTCSFQGIPLQAAVPESRLDSAAAADLT